MRAAFHDAGTYDPTDQKRPGGANGALRLKSVYSREENGILGQTMAELEEIKATAKKVGGAEKVVGELSYADLI